MLGSLSFVPILWQGRLVSFLDLWKNDLGCYHAARDEDMGLGYRLFINLIVEARYRVRH